MSESTQISLADAAFFNDFPDDIIRRLQESSTRRRYKKNTNVINLGDDSRAAYLLLSGSAKAFTENCDGNEFIVNTFGPGDCFGELGLLDERPRSANVITTSDSECLVISKSEFRQCIFDTPDAAAATILTLTTRIRDMTEEVSCIALLDVYGRIARLIKNSIDSSPDNATAPMTHQDIADRIGSSREMVSRIMKDLSTGDYIKTDNRRISVLKNLPDKW